MARRGGRGPRRGSEMDDREFERRLENYEAERDGDDGSDIIMTFVYIAAGLAAVYFGLGWLDGQFGWETQAWLRSLFHSGGDAAD